MDLNDPDLRSVYATYIRKTVRPAHSAAKRILKSWKNSDFWAGFSDDGPAIPQPVYLVESREKRLESVKDKFARDPQEFPQSAGIRANLVRMRDVLGLRVVVFVPAQLRLVDDAIRHGGQFTLAPGYRPRAYLAPETFARIGLAQDDFEMKGAKRSGYASIHYFVQLNNSPTKAPLIFEIQVRTMLEQVWATVEHQLGYKSDRQTEFSVTRQFRVISHHFAALDDHLDFIHDHLTYLQSQSHPSDVDLLNAENLPSVLREAELPLRQSEVDSLLNILETYAITTVRALRVRLTPSFIEPLREEHSRAHGAGRLQAFDVVPVVAQLPENASEASVRVVFRESAATVKLMRQLRYEFGTEN